VLNPGSILGRGAVVYPNVFWRGILPANSIAKNKAEIEVVVKRRDKNFALAPCLIIPPENLWAGRSASFRERKTFCYIDFLQDLANFGSNLIPRCYVSSERTLGDTVLIASLLKHDCLHVGRNCYLTEARSCFSFGITNCGHFLKRALIFNGFWKMILKEKRLSICLALRRDLDWTRSVLEGNQGERPT